MPQPGVAGRQRIGQVRRKKIKTTTAVFELGILQYVEYEPPPREWCTDGCPYEGVLTAHPRRLKPRFLPFGYAVNYILASLRYDPALR